MTIWRRSSGNNPLGQARRLRDRLPWRLPVRLRDTGGSTPGLLRTPTGRGEVASIWMSHATGRWPRGGVLAFAHALFATETGSPLLVVPTLEAESPFANRVSNDSACVRGRLSTD